MLVRDFFQFGEGYVLGFVCIGFYLFMLSIMLTIRYSNRNKNVETKLFYMYSIAMIQLGLVILVVIYPTILTVMQVFYFSVMCTWILSAVFLFFMYMSIKNSLHLFNSIVVKRKKDLNINHKNKSFMKLYYILSTVWLIVMLGIVLFYSIVSVKFEELFEWNLLTNILVILTILVPFKGLSLIATYTLKKIEKDETEERNHFDNCPNVSEKKLKDLKVDSDLTEETSENK